MWSITEPISKTKIGDSEIYGFAKDMSYGFMDCINWLIKGGSFEDFCLFNSVENAAYLIGTGKAQSLFSSFQKARSKDKATIVGFLNKPTEEKTTLLRN